MTELTYEEFCAKGMLYVHGITGDWGASRMYRNEKLKIQKEVHTERQKYGDIYSGWKDSKVYFSLDGDKRVFENEAELYVAYMEKVCGVNND